MIKAIGCFLDKNALRDELAAKQRLYAQMMKDQINGPVLKKLSEEIGQLNLQLYGHGNKQQRA
jgi:hypothetical protein